MANMTTWTFMGYNMLVFLAALQSIPRDLYEAARLDGAGEWGIVRRIKVPLVRNATLLTVLLSIIGTIQLFNEPTVLATQNPWMGRAFTPMMMAYNSMTGQVSPSGAGPASAISLLMALAAAVLAPIAWLIISSTKSNNQLYASNPFATGDQLVNNYHALIAWTQGNFWRWVGNSVLYSTVAGAGGTLVSVAAGYGLAKFRIPGKGLVMGAILGGLLMPIALLTVPLYLLFHSIGLVDTMWAVIIPSLVSPFGVFLGHYYVQATIPDELLEAARLDGAGEIRIFFSIVLRLLAPAMVTIFLFIFVATWNNFLLPLMMISTPELKPVTLGLYGMMSYFNPVYGAVLQGALLGVIPLIILFLGLQRYWQAGLTSGSVKT